MDKIIPFEEYVRKELSCLHKRTEFLENYHTRLEKVEKIYVPIVGALSPIGAVLLTIWLNISGVFK